MAKKGRHDKKVKQLNFKSIKDLIKKHWVNIGAVILTGLILVIVFFCYFYLFIF